MPNQNKVEKRETRHMPVSRTVHDMFSRWERDMDRMFDDFWRRPFLSPWGDRIRNRLTGGYQAPPLDIYQDKDNVIIKADLPGMTKEDIEVTLQGSTLTIKGEKKREQEIREEDYFHSERSFGGFVRNVQLPTEVNFDKVDASFKDGVLEIRLPKTEKAKEQTRTIPIL